MLLWYCQEELICHFCHRIIKECVGRNWTWNSIELLVGSWNTLSWKLQANLLFSNSCRFSLSVRFLSFLTYQFSMFNPIIIIKDIINIFKKFKCIIYYFIKKNIKSKKFLLSYHFRKFLRLLKDNKAIFCSSLKAIFFAILLLKNPLLRK